MWQVIKKEVLVLTGNATGDIVSAAVRSLGEKIQLQLEKDNNRMHYIIFNLSQSYYKSLNGCTEYQEWVSTTRIGNYIHWIRIVINIRLIRHFIHGILFGVWIFEWGTFENLGIGTFQNWMFGGYKGGNWTRTGEPIKFFRKPYFPWAYNYGVDGRLVKFSKIK